MSLMDDRRPSQSPVVLEARASRRLSCPSSRRPAWLSPTPICTVLHKFKGQKQMMIVCILPTSFQNTRKHQGFLQTNIRLLFLIRNSAKVREVIKRIYRYLEAEDTDTASVSDLVSDHPEEKDHASTPRTTMVPGPRCTTSTSSKDEDTPCHLKRLNKSTVKKVEECTPSQIHVSPSFL